MKLQSPLLDVKSDRAAIIQLIKSCGKKKDISTLRSIQANTGLISQDISIPNTLIRWFAKCGAVKEARELFDRLPERTIVSWNALIAGYVDQGFGEEALTCFREMESDKVIPNSVTFVSSLKACAIAGALDVVEEIDTQVKQQGIMNKDIVLGTTLVYAYAKCGAMRKAQNVFDQLTERDIVSWGALIAGYADQGFGEEALKCFKEMESEGLIPNTVTFVSCFKACAAIGVLDIVEEMHNQVREQGLHFEDVALGNAIVNAYAKCGAMKESQEVFYQLRKRDVVSWNSLITGYADQGFGEEALKCYRDMVNDGYAPDLVSFVACLKACAIVGDLQMVEEIHGLIRQQGLLTKDITLGNALLNAYAKSGALSDAHEVFEQLAVQNIVSWSALIIGYVDQGFCEEALACFRNMKLGAMTPDYVTYVCCLKACSVVGDLEVVREIHNQVRQQGLLKKDIALGNALINAYAKCGSVKEAHEVFNHISERNIVSWSALLAGYAQIGHTNEMMDLFSGMMKSGISPDTVTLLVVLNGCSHGALLGEGERLFDIVGAHGTALNPEHYTCMVDMFGRAGQLDKAKCFLIDHTPTLLTFLGACQKWVNVDLGRWSFEKLLQVDQKCIGAYVCMSNIYAAAGMMKEAEEIEILRMKEKVQKQPECWWTNGTGTLHTLVISDRSNPQSICIYSKLGELHKSLSREGWSHRVDLILEAIHDPQKVVLYCHNQKKAIAFALL